MPEEGEHGHMNKFKQKPSPRGTPSGLKERRDLHSPLSPRRKRQLLRGALPPQKERLTPRLWWKQNWISVLVLALAALVFAGLLWYSHQGQIYQNQSETYKSIVYESAEVLDVLSDTVTPDRYQLEENELGQQELLIRLVTGEFRGETLQLTNHVALFYGTRMQEGDKLIVALYISEGKIVSGNFYEYDRTPFIFVLLAIFVAVTVLVGGKTGLKSLVGLTLTVICLICIFCPLLMKGADPVFTALWLCIYVEIVCFTLLDGVNKKTVCAMLGTAAGMLLAVLFAALAQKLTRITSYSMYSTNSLVDEFRNIQQQGIPLHIHGLLSAGVVISSLGAVMDVAMSLSSAIRELKTPRGHQERHRGQRPHDNHPGGPYHPHGGPRHKGSRKGHPGRKAHQHQRG